MGLLGPQLSVLKRCVPKTLAFAFGLRLRSKTRCFKTRVLGRRLPNGKPQERLRFRDLRSKTLAFKKRIAIIFLCDPPTNPFIDVNKGAKGVWGLLEPNFKIKHWNCTTLLFPFFAAHPCSIVFLWDYKLLASVRLEQNHCKFMETQSNIESQCELRTQAILQTIEHGKATCVIPCLRVEWVGRLKGLWAIPQTNVPKDTRRVCERFLEALQLSSDTHKHNLQPNMVKFERSAEIFAILRLNAPQPLWPSALSKEMVAIMHCCAIVRLRFKFQYAKPSTEGTREIHALVLMRPLVWRKSQAQTPPHCLRFWMDKTDVVIRPIASSLKSMVRFATDCHHISQRMTQLASSFPSGSFHMPLWFCLTFPHPPPTTTMNAQSRSQVLLLQTKMNKNKSVTPKKTIASAQMLTQQPQGTKHVRRHRSLFWRRNGNHDCPKSRCEKFPPCRRNCPTALCAINSFKCAYASNPRLGAPNHETATGWSREQTQKKTAFLLKFGCEHTHKNGALLSFLIGLSESPLRPNCKQCSALLWILCTVAAQLFFSASGRATTTTTQNEIWCNISISLVLSRFCIVKWRKGFRCSIWWSTRWGSQLSSSRLGRSLFYHHAIAVYLENTCFAFVMTKFSTTCGTTSIKFERCCPCVDARVGFDLFELCVLVNFFCRLSVLVWVSIGGLGGRENPGVNHYRYFALPNWSNLRRQIFKTVLFAKKFRPWCLFNWKIWFVLPFALSHYVLVLLESQLRDFFQNKNIVVCHFFLFSNNQHSNSQTSA